MARISRAIIAVLIVLGAVAPAFAQKGTLTPDPWFTVLDNNGKIVNAACVWTYQAGTTTAATTYSDVNLTSPNANPIIVGSDSRATIYLVPGQSYKFTVESPPCSGPSTHGAVIKTQDNINAVPASSSAVDVTGTAGENIAAGQCAYLSDGSGGKTAGQWFKCDSANTYSSTTAEVGIAPSAINSASSGAIRIQGSVPGLTSLSVGSEYFVGSAGALTVTAQANKRHLGHADTATSLVLTGNPQPPFLLDNTIDDFRLTLTTAVPVTTSDVTAATTVYCSPYKGNRIALFDGNTWNIRTSAEFSIAVPATTSQMYDVFVFDNAGVATLEVLAWTNDTTRATALVLQDGVYVKTGATTRRYVGSFRTTTVSGQTEDSGVKRYLWNYYNRVPRKLQRNENNGSSWTYTTATTRQANASTANQVDVVVGVVEQPIDLAVDVDASNGTGGAAHAQIGVGIDSTTVMDATNFFGGSTTLATANALYNLHVSGTYYPTTAGRHFYAWLEFSAVVGTTTWNTNNVSLNNGNGLHGWVLG